MLLQNLAESAKDITAFIVTHHFEAFALGGWWSEFG